MTWGAAWRRRCRATALLLAMGALLAGCGDVDYTRKDADHLAGRYARDAAFVSEAVLGEKETAWTYEDRDFGFEFTVRESPGSASFDGMHWDTRELTTDHDAVLARKVHAEAGLMEKGFGLDEGHGKPAFTYEAASRQDMEEAISALSDAMVPCLGKARRKSLDVRASFTLGGTECSCAISQAGLSRMEDDMLKKAIVFWEEGFLSHFSEQEIEGRIDRDKDHVLLYREGSGTEDTRMLVYAGNTWVCGRALYRYLKRSGMEVSGTPELFSFKRADGATEQVSGEDTVSFFRLRGMLGADEVAAGQGTWLPLR